MCPRIGARGAARIDADGLGSRSLPVKAAADFVRPDVTPNAPCGRSFNPAVRPARAVGEAHAWLHASINAHDF
ncbi:protein of unassigned function [Methylobacterium oryzae CBMB20]|uniref:Protein of unassigned function n=1 Tax=Methylobacterium oryzae CBMB20 TaxID=693986 RepID=A0A089NS06_9HYPH|nr:protein of unassigned function [Methylobacterium oryzae CBMB20]